MGGDKALSLHGDLSAGALGTRELRRRLTDTTRRVSFVSETGDYSYFYGSCTCSNSTKKAGAETGPNFDRLQHHE